MTLGLGILSRLAVGADCVLFVSRVSVLEKKCFQKEKEKELIEKKMQRIEKAKDQEIQELRDKLDASQGDVRTNLKAKDDKINEVCEVTSA